MIHPCLQECLREVGQTETMKFEMRSPLGLEDPALHVHIEDVLTMKQTDMTKPMIGSHLIPNALAQSILEIMNTNCLFIGLKSL